MKHRQLKKFFSQEVIVLPLVPTLFFFAIFYWWQFAWIVAICIYIIGMIAVRLRLNSTSDA